MSAVVDALMMLLAGIGIGALLAVAETRARPLLRRWWAHRPRRTPRQPRRYHRGDPDAPPWRAPARGGYSAVPEREAYLPTPLPPGPPPGVRAAGHVCDPTCASPEQHARNVADDAHALTVHCPRCYALVTQPCFDPIGTCLARYVAADLAARRASSAHPNRRPRS